MDPLVYEINTRFWLDDLSKHAGKPINLANISEEEFASWRERDFTHIWLMGVWECGPVLDARPDAAASPYAITSYDVQSSFGGRSGLAQFHKRLHAHGLKLILDFVPNHTSCSHPRVRSHPTHYVHSQSRRPGSFQAAGRWIAHGKDPYFPPWIDTAQVDVRNPAARKAIIGDLLAVAAQCDGVRCDMAMLLLNDVFSATWKDFPSSDRAPASEFWADATSTTRRLQHDFLFLAEAYWDREQQLLDLGFDYAYDKRVYDYLVTRDPAGLASHLASKSHAFIFRTAHFLENHDEARIASILDFEEHRAASLLTLALPGLRLLHEGQLTGATIRASVHRRHRPEEPINDAIAGWYKELLSALKQSAVGKGAFNWIPTGAENVFALTWTDSPGSFDLVVVNLDRANSREMRIPLPSGPWHVTSCFGSNVPDAIYEGHVPAPLPPHAAWLLRCRKAQE